MFNSTYFLNSTERKDLLLKETGIDWNSYPSEFINGIVTYRKNVMVETEHGIIDRRKWTYESSPFFHSENGKEFLKSIIRDDYGKKEEEKEVQQNQDNKENK